MLWAVFVLFVVEVSYGLECIDDGWSQYYGKCYLFSDAVGAMTHDQCGSYCAGFDATMLCVDGSTTENILQWYTSPMWLANSDVNDTNTYTWGPGCANHGYTHWLPSEPSSGGVGGNCVELVAGINGVEGWNSVDCANGYQSLCYCQKPATAHVDCPEGWQSDGKACYLIDLWKKPTNYPECTDFCSAYNGMPLCIEDQEKEDYILNHMGYLPSVWVAYTDNAGVGDWQWATSCPYSEYSHWSTATDMPMMGNGRCTIMYNRAQQANGLYDWHNYNCQHTTQEQYCFCQAGAGSDAVPYNADSEFSGSGSGSSSLSTSYIILIAVLGGVFVVALCGCAVWYYCALKRLGTATGPSFDVTVGQYSAVNTGGPGHAALSSGNSDTQHSYQLGGVAAGPSPPLPLESINLSVVMQQTGSKTAASAPPMVTPATPQVVAVATALPYESLYNGSGRYELVVADAVVFSEAV